MPVKPRALSPIQGRCSVGLSIDDVSNMAQNTRIEDCVHTGMVVVAPIMPSLEAITGSDGISGPGDFCHVLSVPVAGWISIKVGSKNH
jgi:hypothetical protein